MGLFSGQIMTLFRCTMILLLKRATTLKRVTIGWKESHMKESQLYEKSHNVVALFKRVTILKKISIEILLNLKNRGGFMLSGNRFWLWIHFNSSPCVRWR